MPRQIAYVLNLEERPDRWKAMKKRFHNSEFLLRRFPAIPHENGAYGNFMTFLKVFRMAKRENLESILILEDDVVPTRGWESKWRDVKEWLDTHPDAWDIYSGGAWGGRIFVQDTLESIGLSPTPLGKVGESIIFKYPFITLGAHWMYIPNRSFDKLLNIYSNLQLLPQISSLWGMDFLHGFFFNIVSSYPFIARQRALYSNITHRVQDRNSFFETSEKRLRRALTRKAREKD
jgi:hypothetical protein